jgi:iron complex transport system permease protein
MSRAAAGELSPRWVAAAVAALLASLLAGLAIGPIPIPFGGIVEDGLARLSLGQPGALSPLDAAIVWELRAPRVVLGALVGGMLALAGGAYQAVFRNPLADPYLLGAAAGAGLGATIALAYGAGGGALLPLAAFVGGAAAAAAAYLLGATAGAGQRTATLLLAGVAVASFLTAVQTFVLQQNSETVREVYSWILGQLDTADSGDVVMVAPYILVSAAVILAHRRVLDVLRVGDEEARSLGVDVGRVRLIVLAAATVGTAAAISVTGLIGFVGIIVPHTVRLIAGASYRVVLPLSLLFGASFLVLADIAARVALAPAELPIGVVTAVVGAPFFAVVLRTSRLLRT